VPVFAQRRLLILSEYFSGDTRILKNIETVPDTRGSSQRRYPRFNANIDTIVECGNSVCRGTIVNVGKKGCRVITDKTIPKGTNLITLRYIFPGELDTRIVRGTIKWTEQKENSFHFGIEFDRLQNF